MHSVMVISGGLLLLVVFCLVGRAAAGKKGIADAALWFMPVWLVAALYNMSVGVRTAGYTVVEEIPFLLVVFGVPAIVAWFVRKRFAS